MAKAFDELVAQARQLSASDRTRLIEELLHSLASDGETDAVAVAQAWEAEVDRRLDEAEAGGVTWLTHRQIMAKAWAKVAAVVRSK